MKKLKTVIAGAGAIGTAMGNVLAEKDDLNVVLLSIESEVVASINSSGINSKYFPGIRLSPNLKATTDPSVVEGAAILFLAVPSVATIEVLDSITSYLNEETILVNLAKGYGNGSKTVAEIMLQQCNNPVVSFKGPAFARELINHIPTGFTVGTTDARAREFFKTLTQNTCIYIDFSDDIPGVELAGILKNIYAIAIGIVDAHFNALNLRFMILTRVFNEIRELLALLGGQDETLFRYCGLGDFALTALNDLSRNRTLGLLIGKGFFSETISEKVVLEGRLAINIISSQIIEKNESLERFPVLNELQKVFTSNYNLPRFVQNIL
jgi:glycerol-3-phosphate dehydrogenase (NAD(P)+)